MCIIIAKDKNSELPNMDTIETCFNHNSDGAGLMYVDKGQVVIDKGFMTFKELKKKLEVLYKRFNNFKDKSLVIHCRIGTSGTNTRENTHPYCISENYKDLHRTKVVCDLGMVHNGIINQYTPIDNKHNTNDTQEFIMKYLTPIYEHYRDFYKNKYILEGLEDITNSRLVFLDSNDDLYYVGDFEEENGVKYSNSSYKPYTFKTYTSKYDYYTEDSDYWNSWWDKKTKEYLNEGYTYLDPQEVVSKESLKNRKLSLLQPNWYVSNNYGWEKVGDRIYYIDEDTYELFEELQSGEMLKIGEDTFVYDEDYNDVF